MKNPFQSMRYNPMWLGFTVTYKLKNETVEDCARFTNSAPQIDRANQFLNKVTFSGCSLKHLYLFSVKLFIQS